MALNRPLIFWIFLFLYSSRAAGTTFTVTSNADSGPGSLRDAITQAASNGSGSPDLINFNIADQSVAGRTVVLLSELPALSGNLVVDGTTQAGTSFGISNAKVALRLNTDAIYPFTGLLIDGATNVEVYGILLATNFDPRGGEDYYGIRIKNSSNITIGAKGKGNVIYGWFWDITNSYYNSYNDYAYDVSIKGNMLGVTENDAQSPSQINILLNSTYNLEIGGTDPGEGNQMRGAGESVEVNYKDPSIPGSFFVKMINNKVNVNSSGTAPFSGAVGYPAVNLNGSSIPTTDTEVVKTLVSNNIISTSGEGQGQLRVLLINHLVKITGNKIGTDITGAQQIGSTTTGINVYNCYKVLIGGDDPADKNYIAGCDYGVYVASPKTLVTKNSTFCNGQGIYILSWAYRNPEPVININTYTSSLIAGTSNPKARIELFQNHDCAFGNCQGKTYVATVYADDQGKWAYTGAQTPSMVATATTTDSATSAFTVPQYIPTNVKITPATCGRSNGSITGMQVINATNFRWADDYAHNAGYALDLVNVPAGEYSIFLSLGNNGCTIQSAYFTIPNLQPPASISPNLVNTTCGQQNGLIQVFTDFSNLTTRWINTLGDTVVFPSGKNGYFNAGTYSLVAYVPSDYTCLKTYGPYTLTNQGGAAVDITSAVVTPASCRLANGSITSLQFNNVTGASYYRWVDTKDNTVGNAANLLNVPAGQYRLKFKDQGPCDTVVTDIFTVGSTGLVHMDSSGRTILPSKCSVNSGSIQNIIVENAFSYQWIDTVTRVVAANAASLTDAPPGYYKLIATNTAGCTDSTGVYQVPLTSTFSLIATYDAHPEACSRKDGSISIATLNANPADYNFRWTLTSTGQLVGSGLSITNLATGSYSLYSKDGNGCDQLVGMTYLNEAPAPEISNVTLTPDVCLQKTGSISPDVKGSSPFSYAWYDASGQLQSNDYQLNNRAAGDYSVVITDVNNCSTTSSYRIVDSSVTIDAPHYPDLLILKDSNALLNPIDPASGLYLLYSSANALGPDQQNTTGDFTVGPLTADTTVYVIFAIGACTSPLTPVHIKVVQTLTIVMPNAFTPNNDGHNDIFRVKYPEAIRTFRMNVFNRWGQLIFSSEDPYRGWDGNFKGQAQPAGTYVWMINYLDVLGNSKGLSGTVMLLR